jgi:hypothetical protein
VGLAGDKSTLLPADVAAILERPELRSATIGLYAINLKTGSAIIKYNSTRASVACYTEGYDHTCNSSVRNVCG